MIAQTVSFDNKEVRNECDRELRVNSINDSHSY